LSYAQIGQGFGGRDHSTVMNAIRTTQKKLAADANVQQDLQELNRILTAV
jgi:chromosomal replication initiator protein